MKHATALLVSVFMAATAGAQEDQFSTVITPAFSPITWERLVDARNEPNTNNIRRQRIRRSDAFNRGIINRPIRSSQTAIRFT